MPIIPRNIIETLTNVQNANTFTVDNSQPSVPIVTGGGTLTAELSNVLGNVQFAPGDNFEILSIGIALPLQFQLYDTEINSISAQFIPSILLQVFNGATVPLPGLNNGQISIPFANYEYSIGQFINVQTLGMNPFWLLGKFNSLVTSTVNMSNVPNSLNGQTFSANIFIKIQHNFPLTGSP